jgi:hypothetical protein
MRQHTSGMPALRTVWIRELDSKSWLIETYEYELRVVHSSCLRVLRYAYSEQCRVRCLFYSICIHSTATNKIRKPCNTLYPLGSLCLLSW